MDSSVIKLLMIHEQAGDRLLLPCDAEVLSGSPRENNGGEGRRSAAPFATCSRHRAFSHTKPHLLNELIGHGGTTR